MDAIKNIFAQVFSEKNMKMLEKMGRQAFEMAKSKSSVLMKEAKKMAEQKGKAVAKKADEVKKEAAKKVGDVKKEPAKSAKKKEWLCGVIVFYFNIIIGGFV